MPRDPLLALRMDAYAQAHNARVGEVDSGKLASLQAQAEDQLPEGHRLRVGIVKFVAACAECRHDPAMLAEHGLDLCDLVDQLNVPEPPDLGRKDIHG